MINFREFSILDCYFDITLCNRWNISIDYGLLHKNPTMINWITSITNFSDHDDDQYDDDERVWTAVMMYVMDVECLRLFDGLSQIQGVLSYSWFER